MHDSLIFGVCASILLWFMLGVIFGFAGSSIVEGKGYPQKDNHGFAWGFWLGFLGIIVCVSKPAYTILNLHRIISFNDNNTINTNIIDNENNNNVENNAVNNSFINYNNAFYDADLVLKYKELLDSGAISQEEFETKKKEILRLNQQ